MSQGWERGRVSGPGSITDATRSTTTLWHSGPQGHGPSPTPLRLVAQPADLPQRRAQHTHVSPGQSPSLTHPTSAPPQETGGAVGKGEERGGQGRRHCILRQRASSQPQAMAPFEAARRMAEEPPSTAQKRTKSNSLHSKGQEVAQAKRLAARGNVTLHD